MKARTPRTPKKYQPDRQDILWNTDWGIPESAVTKDEAKEQRLQLYWNRWVAPEERSVLKRQCATYRLIRVVAVVIVVCGMFWASVTWWRFSYMLPDHQYWFWENRPPMPLQSLTDLLILLIMWIPCAVAGLGLFRFNRWAWYSAIVIVLLTILLTGLYFEPWFHDQQIHGIWILRRICYWLLAWDVRSLLVEEYGNLVLVAFLGLCLYWLLRESSRRVFERRPVQRRERVVTWYKTIPGKLLIAGPLVTIAVVIVLVYVTEKCRRDCDRAAQRAIEGLQASMVRLAEEVVAQDCDPAEVMKHISEDHVRYIVGPYYGWSSGTNWKCKVLLRIQGNEVHGCSLRGSRPKGDKRIRLIFRVPIAGSALWGSRSKRDKGRRLILERAIAGYVHLDTIEGPCTGRPYGYFPDHTYFASMVGKKDGACILKEPDDLSDEDLGPVDGSEEDREQYRKERRQEREDYRKELERYQKK